MPENKVTAPLTDQPAEDLPRPNPDREQVLARLWEIANLSPDKTRNSITGQVKAISLIIAIEGLIPGKMTDRRAGSAQNKPASPPNNRAQIYTSAWLGEQQQTTAPVPTEQDPGVPPVKPAAGAPPNPAEPTLANSPKVARDLRVPSASAENPYGSLRLRW